MRRLLMLPLLLGVAGASPAPQPWRELLLPRTELADSANALVRWRPLYEAWTLADRELAHTLAEASSPLAPPSGDPAFRAWLAAAAPALSQAAPHAGEQVQFPRIHGPETPFPDHQPLRQLASARVALMKLAWADGRPDDALALALENLALSRGLLGAQEGLIPLLASAGVWQVSLDGVYWLARQPGLTPAQAARLQAALLRDDRVASAALSRGFRGELTFFTQIVVERLPRTRDPELLLHGIGSLGMAPPVAPAEGEPRLAVPDRDLLDIEATLAAAADDVRGWVDAFASGRHPRGFTAAHTHARLHGYAREIPALLAYATQDAPPTPAQIEAANAELASVENPVGKLFLIIATSQWEPLSAHVFRREAQRSALTGLLAWRRLGKPAPWKEVVTAGLLAEAPADPFGDGALRAAFTPPRVWSVGVNGTDEGGAGDGENIGLPDDFTWPAKESGPGLLHEGRR